MSTFSHVLAQLAPDGEGFAIEAPVDWAQGRTLYGGITAALAYRAVMDRFGDLGPLRSAQFCFIGPAAGRLCFKPQILRKGRSATVISADCQSAEGIAARSTFVFGAPRESVVTHDYIPRPSVPSPEECEPLYRTTKALPGFLGRFELRLASGSHLFQPGNHPEYAVWLRLRDAPGPGNDTAALLAIGDALPAAGMISFPKPAPISTMTWSYDLLRPSGDIEGWHLITSSSRAAADGYSSQDMVVYDGTGAPVAVGRQVVALFA